MRQHITPEQLAELTQEQQERLREWWKPELGDHFIQPDDEGLDTRMYVECDDRHYDIIPNKLSLPRLSVGQCIEFLNGTRVDIKRSGLNNDFTFNDKKYPELIDGLWDRVKGVLRDEQ